MNVISWTDDLMRIFYLETLGSIGPGSSDSVKAQVSQQMFRVYTQLLRASISRRDAMIQQAMADGKVEEAERLEEELAGIKRLSGEAKQKEGIAKSSWSGNVTVIVARKSLIVAESEPWMAMRHGL